MKALLLTHKGMEDIASLDVHEIIGEKSEQEDSHLIFDFKKHEDLFKLCYFSQSSK